ncbi:hypothetical protein ACVWZP_001913 [Pseudomonas sp. TE36184]
MSLGSYPQISLKEARARRDEARALVAHGINPYEHRKQQRRAVRFAAEQAFEAVFNQWVEFRRLSLKEGRQSTLSQILRIFNKNVLPILGGWSIYDINRRDLLDLLSRIEQRKALSTAEKCRTWFNQLFRYALVKIEGLEHNPASGLDVVTLRKPPVTHNPFLRMEEFPALMAALRNYGGANQTRLGLRLLLLTGVRTGELRLATPDQFDLEKRLWIIPAEVVKQLQLAMCKPGKQIQNVPCRCECAGDVGYSDRHADRCWTGQRRGLRSGRDGQFGLGHAFSAGWAVLASAPYCSPIASSSESV